MSSEHSISAQTQVLLIDDDPHLRQALSQTLDLAGLKVASLGDAREVAARLPADWPGVVVSDIRMPGIDGLELLQQLRSCDSDLPVILITGHGDIQLAVQAMRAGAYDFLEKPFPSEALLDSVRRALALRQLVLERREMSVTLMEMNRAIMRRAPVEPSLSDRLRDEAATWEMYANLQRRMDRLNQRLDAIERKLEPPLPPFPEFKPQP